MINDQWLIVSALLYTVHSVTYVLWYIYCYILFQGIIALADTVLEAKHKTSQAGVLGPTMTTGLPSHLTCVPPSKRAAAEDEINLVLDQVRGRVKPFLSFMLCFFFPLISAYNLGFISALCLPTSCLPSLPHWVHHHLFLSVFFRYAWQGVSARGATLATGRYAQLPGWVPHVGQISINPSIDLSAFPKSTNVSVSFPTLILAVNCLLL